MGETLRIAGVVRESIVDGKGLRFVVFCQGCPHHCPGCHNPQTHDFLGGYDIDTNKIVAEIKKNPLLQGVTFSGGEPFCQGGRVCGPGEEDQGHSWNETEYYELFRLYVGTITRDGAKRQRGRRITKCLRLSSGWTVYSGTAGSDPQVSG